MRPTHNPAHRSRIPIGFRFIDSKARVFQVYETFWGRLEHPRWTMELQSGTKIHGCNPNGEPQVGIGFYEMEGPLAKGELIIRPIEQIEKLLRNNNLKQI